MLTVLVAGSSGCRVFGEAGERQTELAGRPFSALVAEAAGTCLGVVEGCEILRRGLDGAWKGVASTGIGLQSLASIDGMIFAGGADEARMVRVPEQGPAEMLAGFDTCPGRQEWYAVGPPLGVRSLAATQDGSAVIAAVHVGGLPYSLDRGITWQPTVPVAFDVHEVRAHPTLPNILAAASAVGLCVSQDGGRQWNVISDGLEITYSLAVALLRDEVLFAVSDGPFARRSQIWRWQIGAERVEQVRDGLPEWLDGKVDTAQLTAGNDRVAFVDGGGNLWLSSAGSTGWKCVATGIDYPSGIAVLGEPAVADERAG